MNSISRYNRDTELESGIRIPKLTRFVVKTAESGIPIAIQSRYNRDTELNMEFRIRRASRYGIEARSFQVTLPEKFLQLKSVLAMFG